MTAAAGRLAAFALLAALLATVGAPCTCPAPGAAAEGHCGAPLPGLRAVEHACACPCMTPADAAAGRPDVEAGTPAPVALAVLAPRATRVARAHAAVRSAAPPGRTTLSPPAVLRI